MIIAIARRSYDRIQAGKVYKVETAYRPLSDMYVYRIKIDNTSYQITDGVFFNKMFRIFHDSDRQTRL